MDNFDNFFDNQREPKKEQTPIYHTPEPKSPNKMNVPMIICIVVAVVMTLLVIINVVLLASLKNTIAEEYAASIAQQMQDYYANAIEESLDDHDIIEDVKRSAAQSAVNALGATIGEVASAHTASVARLYMYSGANDRPNAAVSMATGFLISDSTASSKQRYLVTNAHCVRYVASTQVGGGIFGRYEYSWQSYGKIVAVFDNDETTYPLEIVAYGGYKDDNLAAENDMPDLAVLRVKGEQPSNEEHPSLKLAQSDYTSIGSPIALIGNPEGIGEGNSISTGCVSQTGIEISNWGSGTFILTDAALNGGNSGGPMIDRMGVVVGVAESKLVEESIDNMGFALSASTLYEFIMWARTNNMQNVQLDINCSFVISAA